MTYDELLQMALRVRAKYNTLNERHSGAAWNGDKLMAGFVGDVGDLSKIVMAKEGYRHMDDIDARLRHELADCLWSVMTIADYYNVDLEAQFGESMRELEQRVDAELAN